MAKLLQLGISFPHEMGSGIGHVACTLAGVSYESRGGRGTVKGTAARGATHSLFRHRYHIRLSDQQAASAKRYADKCVGRAYVWGGVPQVTGGGGDCSGYVSGIICAALGLNPIRRLFSTGTWSSRFKDLGFAFGLGGGALDGGDAVGRADRPYPGFMIKENSPRHNHVRWIQARLNFAGNNKHAVLGGRRLAVDGEFGQQTLAVVKAFQKQRGMEVDGVVGPITWKGLNAVR